MNLFSHDFMNQLTIQDEPSYKLGLIFTPDNSEGNQVVYTRLLLENDHDQIFRGELNLKDNSYH